MRAGNGVGAGVLVRRRWFGGGCREGGVGRLMLSVGLCLSSALAVLHRSFHGGCTGTDYHQLERQQAGEKEACWVPAIVFRR